MASPDRTPSGDGDQEPPEKPQLQLSLAQVVASAAASVTAGVIASLFGVAGTIIGTVVVSVLATTGSAVYNLSIRRTQHHLRQARRQWREPTRPVQVPADPERAGDSGERRLSAALAERGMEPARRDEAVSRRDLRRLREPDGSDDRAGPWWRRGRAPVLLGGVAALLVAVAVITGVELIGGRPVSAMVGGGGSSGGTSFFGGSGHASSKTKKSTTTTTTTPATGLAPTTTTPGAGAASTTTAPSTAVAPTTTTPPAATTTAPPETSTTVPSGSSATTTPAG